jgi:hypothetical protein
MSERLQREYGARWGAKRFYGANHLVCDLKKGEFFCFPNSPHIFVYCGRGWYKSTAFPNPGKTYRTGTFTACFPQSATSQDHNNTQGYSTSDEKLPEPAC